MKAASLNQFQANLIIEELVRCGVELFCISPGSRNTPLVIAAAEHKRAKTIVHFDERGASFFAVGYAKGAGKPAAMICTSGTAVANYFPAVVEAHESQTPLILLTADRPLEALNSSSYQTIDQREIFGSYANYFEDLPLGDSRLTPQFLLSCVDLAFSQATSADAGPVHLNCRFREPLAPLGDAIDFSNELAGLRGWESAREPYSLSHEASASSEEAIPDSVCSKILASKRGIIVAGVLRDPDSGAALIKLAQQWRWPLISDICSQTRFAVEESEEAVSYADNYLRFDEVAEAVEPDVVLQFGDTPISKFVTRYTAKATSAYVIVTPGSKRIDPHHRVTDAVAADYRSAVSSFSKLMVSASELMTPFKNLEDLARKQVDNWFAKSDESLIGSKIAAEICAAGDSPRSLYLATSMAIREANSFVAARASSIRVAANRGVNGIDGTIAAAVGFAHATRQHTTLVIGDLAALHDLNSLSLVRNRDLPVTIVILNNDGGEIFSYLPVAGVEAHFQEYFQTPHRLDFAQAADMFGIKYYQPLNIRDFKTIYRHTLKSSKPVIIELKTECDADVIHHREFWESLHERARQLFA